MYWVRIIVHVTKYLGSGLVEMPNPHQYNLFVKKCHVYTWCVLAISLIFAHRLWRWANIKPTLDNFIVSAQSVIIESKWFQQTKHETVTRCWFYVGPPSTTLAEHQTNIGWASRAWWRTSTPARDSMYLLGVFSLISCGMTGGDRVLGFIWSIAVYLIDYKRVLYGWVSYTKISLKTIFKLFCKWPYQYYHWR